MLLRTAIKGSCFVMPSDEACCFSVFLLISMSKLQHAILLVF